MVWVRGALRRRSIVGGALEMFSLQLPSQKMGPVTYFFAAIEASKFKFGAQLGFEEFYILRLISSRAFGHIGQQLGAILNGHLQHIQPPPI